MQSSQAEEGYGALIKYADQSQSEYSPKGVGFTTPEELKLFEPIAGYLTPLSKLYVCVIEGACDAQIVAANVCDDILRAAAHVETKSDRVAPKLRDLEMAAMVQHVFPVFEMRKECYAVNPHLPIVRVKTLS